MGLKDYKFVWFTEGGWQGKVSLDNPNMRECNGCNSKCSIQG